MHRRAVGQHGAGRIDRIPGVGGQGDVARVQQDEADVGDALLGAEQRDDLLAGVQLDAEARA